MDKQFFLDAGIPFEHPSMPTWHSLTAMDIPTSGHHFPAPATQPSECFFDSALSSMASSPVSASNESFVLRELIGKLGSICNSGEISPKMNIGSINRAIMENFNTHLGNSIPVPSIGSNLPAGDPGFVERAAQLSSFGSRSFNGTRKTQPPSAAIGRSESSTRFVTGGKLQRVSSSPIINGPEIKNPDCSSSRKRKSLPKGKCRDIPCSTSSPTKVVENGDESNAKRSKLNEERDDGKTEQKMEEEEDEESKKQRICEAPKDYIHVRARRGQATDSHSLAERVRREKISERMKLLQDLVPGCNKVTGKALMLEEIINYVQSLQRQVEFLSMKLANVNPSLEFNTDTHFQKEVFEPNCCMQTYAMDNLAPTVYGGHQDDHLQQNGNTGSGMGPQCANSMDPIHQGHDLQLTNINGFNNGVSELCEGDLHTIVQMGLAQNTTHQSLQGSNQALAMKTEF